MAIALSAEKDHFSQEMDSHAALCVTLEHISRDMAQSTVHFANLAFSSGNQEAPIASNAAQGSLWIRLAQRPMHRACHATGDPMQAATDHPLAEIAVVAIISRPLPSDSVWSARLGLTTMQRPALIAMLVQPICGPPLRAPAARAIWDTLRLHQLQAGSFPRALMWMSAQLDCHLARLASFRFA